MTEVQYTIKVLESTPGPLTARQVCADRRNKDKFTLEEIISALEDLVRAGCVLKNTDELTSGLKTLYFLKDKVQTK